MPDIIINKKNVTRLLDYNYSKLTKGWVTLLEVPVKESMRFNIEANKVLQDLGYEGVYITLSKNYTELADLLEEQEVNLDKMHFIDGITQMYGAREVAKDNVLYVSGPLSIDTITEQAEKILKKIKAEKKYVFLDSITTILLYNSLAKTVEFGHFLTKTLKEMGATGIVVSVARGLANEELVAEMRKISDEVVSLYPDSKHK